MSRKLPRGKTQTLFVRIPTLDWSSVCCGDKTEIRTLVGGRSLTPTALRHAPCPAVAYKENRGGIPLTRMILVEGAWQEPLGAITPESIRNEGYDSLREWKQYWLLRRDAETPTTTPPVFSPLKVVNVIKFRLLTEEDHVWAGSYLLHRLYGAFL